MSEAGGGGHRSMLPAGSPASSSSLCLGATAVPSDASSCVKPLWDLKEWKGAPVSETRVVGLGQLPMAASQALPPGAGEAAPGNVSAGWERDRAMRLGWQQELLT